MQGLKGKTGLTQKEAIFQIIKGVLGDLFQEGADVRPQILKRNDYGRREHASVELDTIVQKITDGILGGTVPSDRYGSESNPSPDYLVSEYARRIALYWLRRDRRLNGGSKPRLEAAKDKFAWYRRRRASNPGLDKISELATRDGEANHVYIYAAQLLKFKMFLECMGIDPETVPEDIRRDLHLFSDAFQENKKTAA